MNLSKNFLKKKKKKITTMKKIGKSTAMKTLSFVN